MTVTRSYFTVDSVVQPVQPVPVAAAAAERNDTAAATTTAGLDRNGSHGYNRTAQLQGVGAAEDFQTTSLQPPPSSLTPVAPTPVVVRTSAVCPAVQQASAKMAAADVSSDSLSKRHSVADLMDKLLVDIYRVGGGGGGSGASESSTDHTNWSDGGVGGGASRTIVVGSTNGWSKRLTRKIIPPKLVQMI